MFSFHINSFLTGTDWADSLNKRGRKASHTSFYIIWKKQGEVRWKRLTLLFIAYPCCRRYFLIAISLLIGFPFEENFSSYSVIIFSLFSSLLWCRSYVKAWSVHPASFTCSREKSKEGVVRLNSTSPCGWRDVFINGIKNSVDVRRVLHDVILAMGRKNSGKCGRLLIRQILPAVLLHPCRQSGYSANLKILRCQIFLLPEAGRWNIVRFR